MIKIQIERGTRVNITKLKIKSVHRCRTVIQYVLILNLPEPHTHTLANCFAENQFIAEQLGWQVLYAIYRFILIGVCTHMIDMTCILRLVPNVSDYKTDC